MITTLEHWLAILGSIAWGLITLILLLGTGLYLNLGLRIISIRKFSFAIRQLFRKSTGAGEISGSSSLMTALAATIGTGNIVGVATAVFLGGPGALFWMWCSALVGMATKYSEAVCAVHFRERDVAGRFVGGPMYYIKNGLGKHWRWLAVAFALLGGIAGFGIGNSTQSNAIANALLDNYHIPVWATGIIISLLIAAVLLGGLKSIAAVANRLVPFMSLAYILIALLIILLNFSQVPHALYLIIHSAFTPTAAQGGFAGASIWMAIRFGVARGVFSNEAGLGSAPIAHAAAKTNNPIRQGCIAMLGPFIDTIIICTMTGLVIILTGTWNSGLNGVALSNKAFDIGLFGLGHHVVTIALVIFAFTTLLTWSYYAERCWQFLFGRRVIVPFRIFWVIVAFIGTVSQLNLVWAVADILNALMALPNLIALLLLSPIIFKLTKDYFRYKSPLTPTQSYEAN